MLNVRQKPVRLGMPDQYKVMQWIESHRDVMTDHTQAQVMRMLKTDLNVAVSVSTLGNIEKAMGIVRVRGGVAGSPARKDRAIVIANELVRLMKECGMVPSLDLVDVSGGK